MTSRESAARLVRRLRPVAVNLGLVGVSIGLAFLLAEVAIRFAAPQQLILIRPDLWEPADTVGWGHRPNVDTQINTGERTVSVFTDAEGFRVGQNGPLEAERQILLLGDSFMEALQVDYEESSAGLLESSLLEAVGAPVAVRNAGVGGWDPDQYLLRARALLERSDYDLILTALYLGNDVIPVRRDYVPPRTPVERYRFRFPKAISFVELTDALLRPANDLLEVRSHLFVFVKNRLQTVRMEVGLAAVSFPPQFLESESRSARWAITAELCEEIDRLARQHGAEALFVFIPTSFQVDPADLMRNVRGFDLDPSSIDLEQPNLRLGDELRSRELTVYDALTDFRSAHGSGLRLYGVVDQHFSPEGNRLFASILTPLAAEILRARIEGLPLDNPQGGE